MSLSWGFFQLLVFAFDAGYLSVHRSVEFVYIYPEIRNILFQADDGSMRSLVAVAEGAYFVRADRHMFVESRCNGFASFSNACFSVAKSSLMAVRSVSELALSFMQVSAQFLASVSYFELSWDIRFSKSGLTAWSPPTASR